MPGKSNVVADALSRRPDLAAVVVDTTEQGAAVLQRVREAQAAAGGASWEAVAAKARSGEQSFCLRDGLVCRRLSGDAVSIVVPEDEELRAELMRQHHDAPHAGHVGLYRMMSGMSARWYW